MSRRKFLAAAGTAAIVLSAGCVGTAGPESTASVAASAGAPSTGGLVVAEDPDPAKLVDRALDAYGGLPVKKGDRVVVKANYSFNRPRESGAANHPQVLARIMERCRDAGASDVLAIDHTIDSPALCLDKSGIKAAVEGAGFKAIAINGEGDYVEKAISGNSLKSVRIAKKLLDADVFINAPVIKSHGSAVMTASMKNLMGVVWDRQAFHTSSLDGCIADIAAFLRPSLIVADAYRVMMRGGPASGGAEDSKEYRQVIVGRDPVAVDAYGAFLLNYDAKKIDYIMAANRLGLGEYDLGKVQIQKVGSG